MTRKFTFAPLPESEVFFCKSSKKRMMQELECPIYWIQPDRLTLWNIELIRDLYLNHNGDRTAPGHQRLIEEYLATLPKVS